MRLFWRRARETELKVAVDKKPELIGTDIGAIAAANDLYLMAQMHPDLRTASKRASQPSFLIRRKGALYKVTVEAVR
jgi:hypothetical protein